MYAKKMIIRTANIMQNYKVSNTKIVYQNHVLEEKKCNEEIPEWVLRMDVEGQKAEPIERAARTMLTKGLQCMESEEEEKVIL